MMTREKFANLIEKISFNYIWKHELNYLLDHDQAQRAVIEQQAKEIQALRGALDDVVRSWFAALNAEWKAAFTSELERVNRLLKS